MILGRGGGGGQPCIVGLMVTLPKDKLIEVWLNLDGNWMRN